MMTDSPGHTGQLAGKSVLRIACPKTNSGGTAFLHKSGKVITAAHILKGNNASDIFLINTKGKKVLIREITTDFDLDIALLTPKSKLRGPSFPVSTASQFTIGSQVSTWGYPTGYGSASPLLSVGWLSGQDLIKNEAGKKVKRWMVNVAINLGNSGGPLIDVETGQVIGIVSIKLAPLPQGIQKELEALSKQKSGFGYTKTF